jgi:MoaA/NifB/PqqE/SkfB family radical SAM enzyme
MTTRSPPPAQSNVLNTAEAGKRAQLQREKPLVHAKIVRYSEKVARGESIAILQFQYDYTCNFKCTHCSADNFMVKTAKAKKADTRRYFTLADVRELYRQADEMGLANTTITGGEPLVYPDLDQLVEAIDPSRFYIAMDTNGWYLDAKRAHHLKSIGVDKIQPSLDSIYPEEHDAFRRKKGAHARVMRAIDAGLEAGLNVMLQTVIWKDRLYSQEFVDYLEFAKTKGIGTYVSLAKPVGCWENQFDQLCGDEDIKYLESLEKQYNVFTHLTPGYGIDVGCIAVKRMVSITKYGDIMPCPYTFTSLGNFFEQPLREIIDAGLKVRHFSFANKLTCIVGNKDDPFIDKYVVKMYGKRDHPIPYREVFDPEDIES